MYRIGQGFDFHKFGEGNYIVLGGVRLEFEKGIIAHSDGDVIIHSIMDAILGALGMPDIGYFFPDTDSSLKGIESSIMLKKVLESMHDKGFDIENIDITLIAERPKIKDKRELIVKNLSYLINIPCENIGLKATTTEKMGPIGNLEGIASSTVVLLKKVNDNNKKYDNTEKLEIYTDGSCLDNPGPGGWSFIVVKDENEVYSDSGGEPNTTNNRMEIKAVLEALKYIKNNNIFNAILYTDSQYVNNTLNAWLVNWEENNWKNASKKEISNKELWQEISQLLKDIKGSNIRFEWIKAHNNNIFNERCDLLAKEKAKVFSETLF